MDPTGFLVRLGLTCLWFACICRFRMMRALIPFGSSYSVLNTANKFFFHERRFEKRHSSTVRQLLLLRKKKFDRFFHFHSFLFFISFSWSCWTIRGREGILLLKHTTNDRRTSYLACYFTTVQWLSGVNGSCWFLFLWLVCKSHSQWWSWYSELSAIVSSVNNLTYSAVKSRLKRLVCLLEKQQLINCCGRCRTREMPTPLKPD